PQFIDWMVTKIGGGQAGRAVDPDAGSPSFHGVARLACGFDVKEVVAEYHILRGVVFAMAEEAGVPLTARESQVVNRVLDTAIAVAVAAFADEQSAELLRRRHKHFAFVAHDI